MEELSSSQKLLRDVFSGRIPDYAIEITKLDLKAGDIVVLKLLKQKHQRVNEYEIEQLVRILRQILPIGVKGLIIDKKNMELAKIDSKDETLKEEDRE